MTKQEKEVEFNRIVEEISALGKSTGDDQKYIQLRDELVKIFYASTTD